MRSAPERGAHNTLAGIQSQAPIRSTGKKATRWGTKHQSPSSRQTRAIRFYPSNPHHITTRRRRRRFEAAETRAAVARRRHNGAWGATTQMQGTLIEIPRKQGRTIGVVDMGASARTNGRVLCLHEPGFHRGHNALTCVCAGAAHVGVRESGLGATGATGGRNSSERVFGVLDSP